MKVSRTTLAAMAVSVIAAAALGAQEVAVPPVSQSAAPGARREEIARIPAFVSETRTTLDYVFVVDVSGSMVGLPPGSGSAVIFPRVKSAISGFISQLQPGASVTLLPFAENVGRERRFDINGPADRDAAIAYLDSLRPDGRETHVYSAVRQAFARYNAFRGSRTDRVAIFLVYTDGRDNGPERMTMQQVVREFGLRRQPDDWLYYATLGLSLSRADSLALEESGFASYVSNPTGQVLPLWVVQPEYAFLHFGNLMRGPRAARVQRFSVSGAGPFPGDAVLQATTDFGALGRDQGVGVAVDPRWVRPRDSVSLRLSLENAQQIQEGVYDGEIRFRSNVRSVLVRPNRIRVRFAYDSRAVSLAVPPWGLRFPKLSSHRSGVRRDTSRLTVGIVPNDEARRRGGRVYVRFEPDSLNPLPDRALLLNGRPVDFDSLDLRTVRSISLAVTARAPEVKPGTYRGKLRVTGGSVGVDGEREIPWQVTVGRPPWPIWRWVLLLFAATGAVVLFLRSRRPVLRGRLVVEEEGPGGHWEIYLSGREVKIDPDAQATSTDPAYVRVVAEGHGRRARPRVYKVVGQPEIRRAGDVAPRPFQNELLDEGDELYWDRYRLSYRQN